MLSNDMQLLCGVVHAFLQTTIEATRATSHDHIATNELLGVQGSTCFVPVRKLLLLIPVVRLRAKQACQTDRTMHKVSTVSARLRRTLRSAPCR